MSFTWATNSTGSDHDSDSDAGWQHVAFAVALFILITIPH